MGNNRQPKTRRNAAEALAGAIFPSWPAKRARDERIGVATLPEKRPFIPGRRVPRPCTPASTAGAAGKKTARSERKTCASFVFLSSRTALIKV
jgi:hypothetical protein